MNILSGQTYNIDLSLKILLINNIEHKFTLIHKFDFEEQLEVLINHYNWNSDNVVAICEGDDYAYFRKCLIANISHSKFLELFNRVSNIKSFL